MSRVTMDRKNIHIRGEDNGEEKNEIYLSRMWL